MLFNSIPFVILVLATVLLYYLPGTRRFQVVLLIIASLVFYGYGQPQLLALLLISIAINAHTSWKVGRCLDHETRDDLSQKETKEAKYAGNQPQKARKNAEERQRSEVRAAEQQRSEVRAADQQANRPRDEAPSTKHWEQVLFPPLSTTHTPPGTKHQERRTYDQNTRLRRARTWAVIGIAANLSILAFFKYAGLLSRTFLSIDPQQGGGVGHFIAMIPLPVGISFFTFQGMSLVADTFGSRNLPQLQQIVHRKASRHWLHTMLFVSYFPQLVAGPILKAHEFLPQIRQKFFGTINWERCFRPLILGYFLKMVIADNLKDYTYWIEYPYFLEFHSLHLLGMLFGYSMQIFADFAGYSLIAIGIGRLFGYELMTNFNFPYISRSFSEFWRRWHISLSSWLRDYLYVPLGGNRKGRVRTYLNLFLVMFLGGLWHGAAWSYAVWGTTHGLFLAVERALRKKTAAQRQKDRAAERQSGRATERQKDRATDGQSDRRAERQKDRAANFRTKDQPTSRPKDSFSLQLSSLIHLKSRFRVCCSDLGVAAVQAAAVRTGGRVYAGHRDEFRPGIADPGHVVYRLFLDAGDPVSRGVCVAAGDVQTAGGKADAAGVRRHDLRSPPRPRHPRRIHLFPVLVHESHLPAVLQTSRLQRLKRQQCGQVQAGE